MAETKDTKNEKADAKEKPISYPPDKSKLKGTAQEATLRIWAAEKRPLCGDDKCYYPLVPKLGPENNYEQVIEKTGKGPMIVAVCSWDPRHKDGKQYLPLPVREGEEKDPFTA